MKQNEEKKAYIEPQILTFSLAGDCPILAGSPPVNTTPTVVAPTEDDDDTNLVPEN
jgi:conserved domain protein